MVSEMGWEDYFLFFALLLWPIHSLFAQLQRAWVMVLSYTHDLDVIRHRCLVLWMWQKSINLPPCHSLIQYLEHRYTADVNDLG